MRIFFTSHFFCEAEFPWLNFRLIKPADAGRYLVMVGSDEPQLQVQVVVPLLHTDEVEDVVVLHAIHTVDLVLVLPGEFVLEAAEHGKVSGEGEMDGGRQRR